MDLTKSKKESDEVLNLIISKMKPLSCDETRAFFGLITVNMINILKNIDRHLLISVIEKGLMDKS